MGIRLLAIAPSWGILAIILTTNSTCDGETLASDCGLTVAATAWPEADVLFHRDPEWLGGDDAYSIDLGHGRVAWFFGDSFVAPVTPGRRRGTTMVRNSVGLQTGYDPTTATFKAYWRETDGKPQSFVADEGKEFFWPGGSILVDGKLLMCMMRARNANRKLAFEITGWGAVLIDHLESPPDRWAVQRLNVPQNPFGIMVGSASLVRDGNHVIAFSVGDKDHGVFLVRWSVANASRGDLTQPEWWTGEAGGWVKQDQLEALPKAVMTNGQTEFTVHCSRPPGCFLQFQFTGFPLSPIGFRTARTLTGPWPAPQEFYHPQELTTNDPELLLYAVKAHPELVADGLALTYCSNTFQLASLFDSLNLYFPRFLQVKLTPTSQD